MGDGIDGGTGGGWGPAGSDSLRVLMSTYGPRPNVGGEPTNARAPFIEELRAGYPHVADGEVSAVPSAPDSTDELGQVRLDPVTKEVHLPDAVVDEITTAFDNDPEVVARRQRAIASGLARRALEATGEADA